MADIMDVDTVPEPTAAIPDLPPLPALHPSVTDPFELLCHALQPFIRLHLSRALGADMVPAFTPAPNATLPTLLRFIDDKWLGVFSDTSLRPHRAKLTALCRMLLRGADLESAAAAGTMAEAANNLLHAVGQSALTARVANALPPDPHRIPATQGLHLVSGGHSLSSFPLPVVLDGANIAWRHGRSSRFSIRGAAEALQYFSTRGHPTVLFLPEARLDKCTREDERAVFEAVKSLEGSEHLVTTPDEDYDDSYICHFARRHGALVVSNDAFRDQVYQASADGKEKAGEWVTWFKACRVSFTFQANLFLPNPSFNFERAAAAIKKLPLKE